MLLRAGTEPDAAYIVRSGRVVAEDRAGRVEALHHDGEARVFGCDEQILGLRAGRKSITIVFSGIRCHGFRL